MIATVVMIAAAAGHSPADPVVARMAALYQEVCLTAFPYDDQVDALMAAKGARPLTPDQVKVTLRDDPGRGWETPDADGQSTFVFLELPPYHACSVRHMTENGLGEPSAYQAIVSRFKESRPGFAPAAPMDQVVGGLHIQATIEQRPLPGGSAEALMVFEQRIADPKRVAAGETRVSLRFVHQIATPH